VIREALRALLEREGEPARTLSKKPPKKDEILAKLGDYPELAARGLKNTGSENYGGPIVTASGLLFIGATIYDRKLRAFDSKSVGTRSAVFRHGHARHLHDRR
jgi:hypothetical protein